MTDIVREPSSQSRHAGRSRLRARPDIEDENGMSEFHSHGKPSKDGAEPNHKDMRDDERPKSDWRLRTVAKIEKDSPSISPRRETYILEDFINSIGRFFGFKEKRLNNNRTESVVPSRTNDGEIEVTTTAADQDEDEKEGDSGRHLDDSLISRTENTKASAETRENGGRDYALSGDKHKAEDDESTSTPVKVHGSPNIAESMDEDDWLSDADVLEMVRLFHRLFSSAEKALKERRTRTASQHLPSSNRAPGRSYQLQDSDNDAEEVESNEELLNKWGVHRQSLEPSVDRGTKELPDVRTALAHAERLNKQRDAERQAKFTMQGGMDEEMSPRSRERSRYSVRERRDGGLREMEESPADMDVERGIRDLPKSAPSYGARKRLLRHRERKEEKTLTEWLMDGLQTML